MDYQEFREKTLTKEEILVNNLIAKVVGSIVLKNQELKLTQTEISEKTGITQANISKILAFEVAPKLDSLAKLLDCFGLDIEIIEKTKNN